jgi:predicted dehydrogenase
MINVGIVGIGFMGMIHYLAYQQVRGCKVVAIATRDKKKLAGDWRGIQGNFGPPGTQMDLRGVHGYADWRAMLDDPTIDVVDICLPPALHTEVALAAFAAGKHVFCEKPIALTTADATRMVRAAAKAGKQLLIGHVLPFMPEYAFARAAITGGKYGKLLGGNFKRVIADPLWIPDFYDAARVGGPVVDLHIHDAHFIRLVCGMPSAVFSTGRMRGEVVEFIDTQFLFGDRQLAVSATSGVIAQQGRSFTHAFEIYLERATILFDSAVFAGVATTATPLTLLTAKGRVEHPALKPVDAFAAELGEVVSAVKANKPSELLSGTLALDALMLCQRETESVRLGRVVKLPAGAR